MTLSPQTGQQKTTLLLRQEAGRWLKARRETLGLSQQEMALEVGLKYYTLVSYIETGRGRIQPEAYEVWAKTLQIDITEFVITLFRYYDPLTAAILLGSRKRRKSTKNHRRAANR